MFLGRTFAALAEAQRLQQIYVAEPGERARADLNLELQLARENLRLLATGYADVVAPARVLLDSLEATSTRIQAVAEQRERQGATDLFVEEFRPRLSAASAALTPIRRAIDGRGDR